MVRATLVVLLLQLLSGRLAPSLPGTGCCLRCWQRERVRPSLRINSISNRAGIRVFNHDHSHSITLIFHDKLTLVCDWQGLTARSCKSARLLPSLLGELEITLMMPRVSNSLALKSLLSSSDLISPMRSSLRLRLSARATRPRSREQHTEECQPLLASVLGQTLTRSMGGRSS